MTLQRAMPKADVGIIIGRFQVHELHEAHRSLIDTVVANHDAVLIFVGLAPTRNTPQNPLDFAARRRMIQETYPDIEVRYVDDCQSDNVWSLRLDSEIRKNLKPGQTGVLYGSRDSFISHYHGKFPVCELEPSFFVSGTEIRKRIANSFPPSREFRAGVISASFDRFPRVDATVDVAIIDWHNQRVLLGRKKDEEYLRFPGGYTDPDSESNEEDAAREVKEETGVECSNYVYLGSFTLDDWRYRGSKDKVRTTLYAATYTFGRPEGADDLPYVEWVSFDAILKEQLTVMPVHIKLLKRVREYLLDKLTKIGNGES